MADQLKIFSTLNWDEWLAIYLLAFPQKNHFEQQQHEIHFSRLKAPLNPDINILMQLHKYLHEIVIPRSKNKLSISLSYFTIFLDFYIQMHHLNTQNIPANPQQITPENLHLFSINRDNLFQSISLEIIRFTSQLSDISQAQKNHQSINSQLGQELQMREHDFISEVRHALTHKHKPPQFIIEKALEYILYYIYDCYWLAQYNKLQNSNLINEYKISIHQATIMSCFQNNYYRVNEFKAQIPQALARQKQKKFVFSQIISQNIYTFREHLWEVVQTLLHSEEIIVDLDITSIKQLARKKLHFAFFVAEILREMLCVLYYREEKQNREIRHKIIKNAIYVLEYVHSDPKIKSFFKEILSYPIVTFKITRIMSLETEVSQYHKLKETLETMFPLELKHYNKVKSSIKDFQTQESDPTDSNKSNQNLETSKNNHNLELEYKNYLQKAEQIQEKQSQNSNINNNNKKDEKIKRPKISKCEKVYPMGHFFLNSIEKIHQ